MVASCHVLMLVAFAFSLPAIATATEVCNKEGQCLQTGVDISDGSCNATEVRALAAASQDLNDFLNAAHFDLHNDDRGLYDALFLPEDKQIILRGIHNLQKIARGQSTAWALSCRDILQRCSEPIYAYHVLSSTSAGSIPPISPIIFCPRFFTMPPDFDPCNKTSMIERTDQVTVMIHEILHTEYMAGPGINSLVDYFRGADIGPALNLRRRALKPMFLFKGILTAKSVSNWQWYIRYAWMQNQQILRCPKAFPLWKAFSLSATSSTSNSLRTLLYADDANATTDATPDAVNCTGTCTEIKPDEYVPLSGISILTADNCTGICQTSNQSVPVPTAGSDDSD